MSDDEKCPACGRSGQFAPTDASIGYQIVVKAVDPREMAKRIDRLLSKKRLHRTEDYSI